MFQFIKTNAHYSVYMLNAKHPIFVATISKYLGEWKLNCRVPFGWEKRWEADAKQLQQITNFMNTLD